MSKQNKTIMTYKLIDYIPIVGIYFSTKRYFDREKSTHKEAIMHSWYTLYQCFISPIVIILLFKLILLCTN